MVCPRASLSKKAYFDQKVSFFEVDVFAFWKQFALENCHFSWSGFCCVISVLLACRRARFSNEFGRMGVPPTFGLLVSLPRPPPPHPNKWIPEVGVPSTISSERLPVFFDCAWYEPLFQKELLECTGARQFDTEERCHFKVRLQTACLWRCYD